ncbi:MAG: hypothetical protein AB7F75_12160 [Planctomycetota bacterium]
MARAPSIASTHSHARHLVAVIALFLFASGLGATPALEDDDAMESAASYLANPTVEGLQSLLKNHGMAWVRHQDRLLTVNHVNWSRFLDEGSKLSYIKSRKAEWDAIIKDPDSAKKMTTFACREYIALELPPNDKLTDIVFQEGQPPRNSLNIGPPGERLWTRQLGPGTRCHPSGTSPLMIHGRRLTLLDPRSGIDIQSLDIPGKDPIEVISDIRGAWILSGPSLWRLDHQGRASQLQLPEGETLAGTPLIGPEGLFAPLRSRDDPCTFFMGMWNWPEGRLIHHHRIFTRADYKGRMRGIRWVPGPIDARSFYYSTHAGALLKCDTLDGQPWELIEYASLDSIELADLDEGESISEFLNNPGSSEWLIRPQDSTAVLRLHPATGRVTACDSSYSPSRLTGDDKTRTWTFGSKSVRYLSGDSERDLWHRIGPLWLQVQDNWVHAVAPLNEIQSPPSAMTSARLGNPIPGSAESAQSELASLLSHKAPVSLETVMRLLGRGQDLPPATHWMPQLWDRLDETSKKDLWRYWCEARHQWPWPLRGGLNIPLAFLDTLWFGGIAGIKPPPDYEKEWVQPEAMGPWVILPPLSLTDGHHQVSSTALQSGQLRTGWPWWSEAPPESPLILPSMIRSTTDAASYWPYASARWLGVHTNGRRLASIELDGHRCFLHIRSGGKRWKSTIDLSPLSRAWCLELGVLVLDEGDGKGYLVSDTGRMLTRFSLLDHGPHQVYMKPGGILLVGRYHALSLARLNRMTLCRQWNNHALSPIDAFQFPVVWGSPPDTAQLNLDPHNTLHRALLLGAQRLASARAVKRWTCSLSHIPLKADGYLNESYRVSQAMNLKGLPGGRAMATCGREGLLIAVIVPDAQSSRLVSRDGVLRGDALRIAWDPMNNARFYPESDDRGLVLGLPDPAEPRKVEPAGKWETSFQGECEIRRDEERHRTIYELFIPWSDLGHRLPVRLDLGIVNDDGSKTWHALGEGITEKEFIPGFMPLLTLEE